MVAASPYFLNVHAIPMFLMGIVTLALGFLVYRSNRQSPAHRHFLMLCASIALWLDATSIGLCSTDAETAFRWFKLDNVGVMFISVAFYGFSAEFLQLQRRRSIWIGYGLATVLAGAVFLRHDFVEGVNHFWWGYFARWGQGSVPFFVIFFSYMAVPFTDYFRAYRAVTTPIRRQQIKFLFPAFVIAYTGSIDFFPAFGYELYPFGYIPIFLLVATITVTILRYRLLDAALVVSRGAVYLPLIPFTLLLAFLAYASQGLSPIATASVLTLTTVVFTVLYVAFQPRLQSAVNKAFFPSRYDAYETLTRFGHAMVMQLDLANLQAEIADTLQRVMGIEKISLYLFDKEHGSYVRKTARGLAEDRAMRAFLIGEQNGSRPLGDSLARAALRTGRRVLAHDYPALGSLIALAAPSVGASGHLAEAESLLVEAVGILRGSPRADPLESARALRLLGRQRMVRHDHAAADTLYTEALRLTRERLGPDHPDVGELSADLGDVLRLEGKPGAERYLREGIAIEQRAAGADHPEVMINVMHLADLLQQHGDLAQAESLYRVAVARGTRINPTGHMLTGEAQHGLAEIELQRGDTASAYRDIASSLAIAERISGVEHRYMYGGLRILLARVFMGRRNYAGAEVVLLDVFETARRQWGMANRRTQRCVDELVRLYDAWGRPERAREYRLLLDRASTPGGPADSAKRF